MRLISERRGSRPGIFPGPKSTESPSKNKPWSPSTVTTTTTATTPGPTSRYGQSNELADLWQKSVNEYNKSVVDVDSNKYCINMQSTQTGAGASMSETLNKELAAFEYYRKGKSKAAQVRSWFANYLEPIEGVCNEMAKAASAVSFHFRLDFIVFVF